MPSLKLPLKVRAAIELELRRRRREAESSEPPVWTPYPDSPQYAAFHSEADVIGFGGAAGGGKSQWLLGMGGTKHYRSTIFRREAVQLAGLIEDSKKLFLNHGSFNGQSLIWRDLPGDRILEFAHVQHPDDWRKHMGRAKGFIGFDELTHFLEAQFWALLGWLRTDRPGLKPQVGCTFNPPTNAEERWVIDVFAPWLDRAHANPAMPGEIRYYARVDGERIERPDGTPFVHDGETITPLGWTFFPARLDDNPIYKATGYGAQLQSLPEPLRSQLLYGDFDSATSDDPWQIIPTAWIEAAMLRWKQSGGSRYDHRGFSATCIGHDVAHGGKDATVNAIRYGNWFAPLDVHPGTSTPTGEAAAMTIVPLYSGTAKVHVDAIGYGASSYERLRDMPIIGDNVYPINASGASEYFEGSGLYKCSNMRAEMYWRFRDALDPARGSTLMLPDDRELLVELAAARYKIDRRGLSVEEKADIKKRIGRSPDKADAVCMAILPTPARASNDLRIHVAPNPIGRDRGSKRRSWG